MISIIQAAGWPIWPLIICSILGLAFIVERFVQLKSARILPTQILDEAIGVSQNGVPGPDTVAQLQQHSALGEVLAAGWRAINTNPRCTEYDMRGAIEAACLTVAHRLERYLPALATIAIFGFIGNWNNFLGPLVYINKQELYTLALGLNLFRGQYVTYYNQLMAVSILSLAPILIIFFFTQKTFIRGIALTGIKG